MEQNHKHISKNPVRAYPTQEELDNWEFWWGVALSSFGGACLGCVVVLGIAMIG